MTNFLLYLYRICFYSIIYFNLIYIHKLTLNII